MTKIQSNKRISKILSQISEGPGVYKFIDKSGKVLYVGKAKNLKKRVRSYFGKLLSTRLAKLIGSTDDISYIEVGSDLEALVLETNLIKELRPKFNILMKDDKNFIYIKITTNEDFPRISLSRHIEKDKALYFGPKTSARSARETLKFLKRLFPYRHCTLDIQYVPFHYPQGEKMAESDSPLGISNRLFDVKVTRKTMKYPCLDYHIKRCVGPCIAKCSKEEYAQIIERVINFLEGKDRKLIGDLKNDMIEASKARNFELAAKIRDKIFMVESLMQKQRVSDPKAMSQDVIAFVIYGSDIYFNFFMIRNGKLINQENFIFKAVDLSLDSDPHEIFTAFLQQYYEKTSDIPDEILLGEEPMDKEMIESWLSHLRGGQRVRIYVPQKGKKNQLLELSQKNALSFARQREAKFLSNERMTVKAQEKLAEILGISQLHRIEGYDISHLGGSEIVGSMVVFENGLPKKSDYRRFRIKIAPKNIDDYLDLKEVLGRRLRAFSLSISSSSIVMNASFRKGKKTDVAIILEILKREGLDDTDIKISDFLICEKESKIIAFGRIKLLNLFSGKPNQDLKILHREKGGEIASLWVDPKHRGHHLGQEVILKLLKKTKLRKIYSIHTVELEDYYTAMGFHSAKDIPQILARKKELCLQSECCKGREVTVMIYRKTKEKIDTSFRKKPDLLLIDGGKGQLNVVKQILDRYHLAIPVVSLAKKQEEVFVPERSKPLDLPHDSSSLHLLQRVRDEAHRFAHDYHTTLRRKGLRDF